MIKRRLMSSDKSKTEKKKPFARYGKKLQEEPTFIMPSQLVINVACSVGGAAADMALRYSCIESAMV